MVELLSCIFDQVENFFNFLSSWHIFGTVSFLDLVITFSISTMIVNVFVGRGKE